MTEILLIRHGETDWNAEKRLQGHLDIGLNAEGLRQACAVGQALLNEPLDAIYASDLQRAKHTAQAIATPRGMTVQIDVGLRERCYGAFEGLRHADISERYPKEFAAWRAREMDARYPDGKNVAETLREFSARVLTAITDIVTGSQHKKIVIVTHGGVLECVYRAATGIGYGSPRDFDILNASINRLVWNGDCMQVIQWSDVTHLVSTALDEVDK
ncbi:MAG TPA: histidine phosphatase family protein [Burkholderiaceae bacterium]|jgi:probable phosphoglycerate mutase